MKRDNFSNEDPKLLLEEKMARRRANADKSFLDACFNFFVLVVISFGVIMSYLEYDNASYMVKVATDPSGIYLKASFYALGYAIVSSIPLLSLSGYELYKISKKNSQKDKKKYKYSIILCAVTIIVNFIGFIINIAVK